MTYQKIISLIQTLSSFTILFLAIKQDWKLALFCLIAFYAITKIPEMIIADLDRDELEGENDD